MRFVCIYYCNRSNGQRSLEVRLQVQLIPSRKASSQDGSMPEVQFSGSAAGL